MSLQMTSRDYEIINFLKEFKCASTSTIQSLFFISQQTCERRLSILVKHGKLKRDRNDILSEYYYYIKRKPINLKHTLYISKLYALIKRDYEVIKYRSEYSIKYRNTELKSDLMTVLRVGDRLVPMLFEIDLSKAYKEKYTEYITSNYYKFKFPTPPIIISISNKTPKSSIKIIWHKLDILK